MLVEPLRQTKDQDLYKSHREEMILCSENKVTKVLFLAFVLSKNFSLMEHEADIPCNHNFCIAQLHICIKNTFGSNPVCSCKAKVPNKCCRNYRIML